MVKRESEESKMTSLSQKTKETIYAVKNGTKIIILTPEKHHEVKIEG